MPEDSAGKSVDFVNLYLADFAKRHPQSTFAVESTFFVIGKPWNDAGLVLKVPIDHLDDLKALNQIFLPPAYSAIFHLDKNAFEFVYGYLSSDESDKELNRKFTFHHSGVSYECHFAEPSERLLKIATYYNRVVGIQSSSRNLLVFRDGQQIKSLPPRQQEYFKNKVPRSFFVRSENKIDTESFYPVARHLNFVMKYYDRTSPVIDLNVPLTETADAFKRLERIEDQFPAEISVSPVDDLLLTLLEVARSSQPRLSFLYYYQALEYAAHTFTDEKTKIELRRLLKDPTIVNCTDDKLSALYTLLADSPQSDEAKIQNILSSYCDAKVLWKEIQSNLSFYSKRITFDGGYEVEPLIGSDIAIDSWTKMWAAQTFKTLNKIRNGIVHARERRQGRAILPTENNDHLLVPYRALIARIAEQVAITA